MCAVILLNLLERNIHHLKTLSLSSFSYLFFFSHPNQIDDPIVVMEKPAAQDQQALRCPRCDSSNTKFCYYNNYSLSQPRHFCKACKRYWTRGGTLRNVPVGGGCRKNKRLKRPTTTSSNNNIDTTPSASSSTPSSNNNINPHSSLSQSHIIDVNPSSTFNSPLLYGLSNSCDIMSMNMNRHLSSFPARFDNSSRYDPPPHHHLFQQHPQLNALGLAFSSSEVNNAYRNNGLISSHNNNGLLLSSTNYNSIFGGSTTTPVMASLLSSTTSSNLLQQNFIMKGDIPFPFHGMASVQENGNVGGMVVASKEVKGEGQNYSGACQNQMDQQQQHMGFSDPSLYWNNHNNTATTTALGGGGATANWSDQHQQSNNIGSSVTSLI